MLCVLLCLLLAAKKVKATKFSQKMVEVGVVTFREPADMELFGMISKEEGGIATGRLAIGVTYTPGHRENFDGVSSVATVGLGGVGALRRCMLRSVSRLRLPKRLCKKKR